MACAKQKKKKQQHIYPQKKLINTSQIVEYNLKEKLQKKKNTKINTNAFIVIGIKGDVHALNGKKCVFNYFDCF